MFFIGISIYLLEMDDQSMKKSFEQGFNLGGGCSHGRYDGTFESEMRDWQVAFVRGVTGKVRNDLDGVICRHSSTPRRLNHTSRGVQVSVFWTTRRECVSE